MRVCAANPTKRMKDEWQRETRARYGLTPEQLAEVDAQLEELAAGVSLSRSDAEAAGASRMPFSDLMGASIPFSAAPKSLTCASSVYAGAPNAILLLLWRHHMDVVSRIMLRHDRLGACQARHWRSCRATRSCCCCSACAPSWRRWWPRSRPRKPAPLSPRC